MNSISMSSCCILDSSQGKVSPELGEEKNATTADDSILNKNRKPTDRIFLAALGLYLIILVGLLGYCMHYGDIYRILNGYDSCGNVCGRINVFDNAVCHGMDMRKLKYLRVQALALNSPDSKYQINYECVENCSYYTGYYTVLNRCIPGSGLERKKTDYRIDQSGIPDFFQEVAQDLHNTWEDILYMCLIAFVFSVLTLLLFKYLATAIVWIVLSGAILIFFILTTLLWIHYARDIRENPDDIRGQHAMFLTFSILSTIITVILIGFVVFLRKRIKLVICLFKEAGKAASDMPLLLIEPVLTFISLSIVIAFWLYFTLWIESSGTLTIQNNNAVYLKDSTMKATRWLNLLAFFWTTQFLIGCQHMAIAGAVATWYFTRNKRMLDSPIITSFKNLYRYHMGTVALGSLLIAAVKMLRELLWVNKSNKHDCATTSCECCLGACKKFLQYISRNAYIETAIYGDSFFAAGSKAFHKIASNALRVFTINTIGDFVLFLGKVFVVAITVLFGMEQLRPREELHHMWIPLSIAGIFAFCIAHCFITVYEMIIDTIFLCFCEDCEMNDGLSRPYYMPTSLMDFVQESIGYHRQQLNTAQHLQF